MAFTSTLDGQKNIGDCKRLFGTWNASAVTTGTITWKGTKDQNYNVIGGGVIQSTTITTAGSSADCQLTVGTMVITCESSAQGYWWVDVR